MTSLKPANREYRDRLFKFIFGNPENREWTLSLYNAVSGARYTDADAIEFNTIGTAVYMSMRNDVSFLVDDVMNLYEQQSTLNPNMPLRFLIYLGMLYAKYASDANRCNVYSRFQQKIPTPKCVCFYNGTADLEDRVVQKLSTAFKVPFESEPDVEVRATMLNVNYGHNRELLASCPPLREYSFFIDAVRANNASCHDLEVAVDRAIEQLPQDSIIKTYLLTNQAEVKRMCITEYKEEEVLAAIRAEERAHRNEEIREEGREEGVYETLVSLINQGVITYEFAASQMNQSVADFRARTGLN